MTWAEPVWHWAWLLVVVLGVLGFAADRRHYANLARVFLGGMAERVLPRSVRNRRALAALATLLGLALLVAALAEPRGGKQLHEVETSGIDLVLVVDLSRSMEAQDVSPDRLERARREILDLLDRTTGDRLGLVIFAAGAYPRMPLTLDHKALRLLAAELDTRTFEAQGSALHLALDEAVKLLENQPGDAGRAILVLTDGEIHDPGAALASAERAAAAGVAVYGLVIGSAPSPIPEPDGTFLLDPTSGAKVMTAPSTDVLTDIARLTGGAVATSVAGDEDIAQLDAELRARVAAGHGRTAQRETWTSWFQAPLLVGLLSLLFGAWLGDGRRAPVTALVALLAVLALPAHAATPAEADALFRAGRFTEAARAFEQLLSEQPGDPDLLARLGAARYRAGDAIGAARAFAQQAELTDDADALFNTGNAEWQAGRLDRAARAYDRALQVDPNHQGAATNRQLLQQEQQQRQAQQQSQKGPGDPQQGEQGEPQDGQPQQGQPQDGQPQDGQPQEGQPQPGQQGQPQQGQPGKPQQGQPQQGQPQEGEPQPGEPGDPSADGTRSDAPPGDATPELGDVDGDGTESTASADGANEGPAAPHAGMSAAQADRTLEGVEEGRPRVYIPGDRGTKPW